VNVIIFSSYIALSILSFSQSEWLFGVGSRAVARRACAPDIFPDPFVRGALTHAGRIGEQGDATLSRHFISCLRSYTGIYDVVHKGVGNLPVG